MKHLIFILSPFVYGIGYIHGYLKVRINHLINKYIVTDNDHIKINIPHKDIEGGDYGFNNGITFTDTPNVSEDGIVTTKNIFNKPELKLITNPNFDKVNEDRNQNWRICQENQKKVNEYDFSKIKLVDLLPTEPCRHCKGNGYKPQAPGEYGLCACIHCNGSGKQLVFKHDRKR